MKLEGIICSLLTPFNKQRGIDEAALDTHLDFVINRGVHGVFVAGTTGEGMVLSLDERMYLTETVLEKVNKRVPVLIHTGAANTKDTITLTSHAQKKGAQGAGIVCPYFYGHDDQSLFNHFQAVAQSAEGFPIFLYNNPGHANNDIKPRLVQKLAWHVKNIAGIKDTSKDLSRFQTLLGIKKVKKDFNVLVGSDSLILPSLSVGGDGVISAVANLFPQTTVACYDAFKHGSIQEAGRLQLYINRIRDILKTGPYMSSYKYYLSTRLEGYPEDMRSPLRILTGEEKKVFMDKIEQVEALSLIEEL